MTDKQIIIDGVDVSGCKYFTTEQPHLRITCLDTLTEILVCSDNPNCYYKQLKRKEQECEKFRKANDEILNENENYKRNLQILEQNYNTLVDRVAENYNAQNKIIKLNEVLDD